MHDVLFLGLAGLEELHGLVGIANVAHDVLFGLSQIAEGFLRLLEVLAGALGVLDAAVNRLAALAEDLGLKLLRNGSRERCRIRP